MIVECACIDVCCKLPKLALMHKYNKYKIEAHGSKYMSKYEWAGVSQPLAKGVRRIEMEGQSVPYPKVSDCLRSKAPVEPQLRDSVLCYCLPRSLWRLWQTKVLSRSNRAANDSTCHISRETSFPSLVRKDDCCHLFVTDYLLFFSFSHRTFVPRRCRSRASSWILVSLFWGQCLLDRILSRNTEELRFSKVKTQTTHTQQLPIQVSNSFQSIDLNRSRICHQSLSVMWGHR